LFFRKYLYTNKLLKITKMGCGCKNKGNQQAQPAPQVVQAPQQQTQTVQESVKKIVEKYYKNK
jgi:hypothetical protein